MIIPMECIFDSRVQLTIAFTLICFLIWLNWPNRKRKTPPGPRAWPIIGNILDFTKDKRTYRIFNDMSKTYGEVFTIYLGPKRTVILNSLRVIQEALINKKDAFSGRPMFYRIDQFTGGGKNIVFGKYDATWKKQRQVTHMAFRKFATGSHLEQIVYKSTEKVVQHLDDQQEAFDPAYLMSYLVYNVISYVCVGEGVDITDPQFVQTIDFLNDQMENFGEVMIADIIPPFRHFYKIYHTKAYKDLLRFERVMLAPIREKLKYTRKQWKTANGVDCFAALLIELEQSASEDDAATDQRLSEEHMVRTMADVFGAGVDTTRFTPHWFIQFMVFYPNVQQKVQQEISQHINTRLPLTTDRKCLPYTEAVLLEVMRLRPIVPQTVPHITTKDTEIDGYFIPKDTFVIGNIWGVHTDPGLWEKPLEFIPERFLNKSQTEIQIPVGFISFSTGPRGCVGQMFSRATLMMTLVILLQSYTFTRHPSAHLDLQEQQNAVFMPAKSFLVNVHRRCRENL